MAKRDAGFSEKFTRLGHCGFDVATEETVSTQNFVPKEMLAADWQREREVRALEKISENLHAAVTFLTMIVDGVCTGSGPYAKLYEVEFIPGKRRKNSDTRGKRKYQRTSKKNS